MITLVFFSLFNLVNGLTPISIYKSSQSLSECIENIMSDGSKYQELQKIYEDIQYQHLHIDWLKKVQQIHDNLGISFLNKRAELDRLANRAASYYDNALSHGFPQHINHINQLSESIFIDSDKISEIFNTSNNSVKIPLQIPENNTKILNTIWWTANLDKVFMENAQNDKDLIYQYFGSKYGVYRSFPIRPLEAKIKGSTQEYDPRLRPWYIAAITKPKNIIIIFDASSTMEASINRARSVTLSILNTLTNLDYLSIIISRSPYYDLKGNAHETHPYVLGCDNQTTLLPANPSFTSKLYFLLEKIKPDGGSNHSAAFSLAFTMLENVNNSLCHNLILFVTDGITLDGSQRCSFGQYYYEYDGSKKFVPGNICTFDHNALLKLVKTRQKQLKKRKIPEAFIFAFATSQHDHSYLKSLCCENHGIRIPIFSSIPIFKALAPYYKFLRNLSEIYMKNHAQDIVWIAPYLDAINHNLVITASKAVYSGKGVFLGVAGIDISLDSLEKALAMEIWNSVSYFIIDKYGHAIIHPLIRPREELIGDPIFIHITLLEQNEGQPSQFDSVLRKMLSREIGNVTINKNAYVAMYNGEYQEGLIWKPIYKMSYAFGPLQGSDFSFAFKIPFGDNLFNLPQAQMSNNLRHPVFLSDHDGYSKILEVKSVPNNFLVSIKSFVDSFTYISPLKFVSHNYSTIHLSSKSFCKPVNYLHNNKPSLETLHFILNSEAPLVTCQEDGILKPYIKSDVILTSGMEPIWIARPKSIQKNVISSFISTFNGVTRLFPALQIPRRMQPIRQAWFNKALLNVGKNVITPIFRPYFTHTPDRVLTFSRAITAKKPVCLSVPGNEGCSCTKNSDCSSNYCYMQSCSNSMSLAVIGMNYRYEALKEDMYKAINKNLGNNQACGAIYPCPIDPTVGCTINCIIINNATQIIIHPNFSSHSLPYNHPPDESEKIWLKSQKEGNNEINYVQYNGDGNKDLEEGEEEDLTENHLLEKNEPFVFWHLVQKQIIYSFVTTDFQAVCTQRHNYPHFNYPDSQTNQPMNVSTMGVRKFNCIKEIKLYAVNHTHLQTHSYGVYNHYVNHTRCLFRLFFAHIPNSNLYMVLMEDVPLMNDCNLHTNFNVSQLVKKREFSLCKDYTYATLAKRDVTKKHHKCLSINDDYNKDICSGSQSRISIKPIFVLLNLIFLMT